MKKFILGILISTLLFSCKENKEETAAASSPTTLASEQKDGDQVLAMSEADGVRRAMQAFTQGDIDGMAAEYADTVKYLWSGLDSLRGKTAVQDYYKGRWALIDSLNYSDIILVPLKTTMQQSKYAPTGKWILAWAFAHVKYKNGKKLDFWFHNVYHYNTDNKIDFVGQYIDRHPLIEATKGLAKS